MQNEPTRTTKKQKVSLWTRIKLIKYDYWLIAILILATFLYTWNIWEAGEANSFYTAAVVSMTKSFKNFWYASFDPAGFITVDKPPVALWFMAISVKIFGVHGWSLVLSSILFGIGSVYLMYNLIHRRFGKIPARLAALIMTLTPIVVADSRTNNMDATLIFFLLLSIYFVQKAVFKNQQRYLWIGFSLMGIAFNVKMLQAFMILPALYLYYWIATNIGWKKKLAHLGIATVFLAVFTLIWPLSVDMTNPSNRPYEGGSETNSALELAFGYNGTQRLLGQTTGTGGAFPGMGSSSKKSASSKAPGSSSKKSSNNPPAKPSSSTSKSSSKKPTGTPPTNKTGNGPGGSTKGAGTGGAGGGAFSIGSVGPFRLFGLDLGPQISWLLIISILGLISSYFYFRGSRMKKWWSLTPQRKELWLWAGWLVPVYGFFSVASFFHPYYTIMLAPAIAALGGVGIYTMIKQWKEKSLWSMILPIAILSTAILQAWYVAQYYSIIAWVLLGVGVLISIPLFALPWISINLKNKHIWPISGVILIMLAPTFWSLTPTIAGESAQIPTAGPSLLTSSGGMTTAGGMGGSVDSTLLKYLKKHQGNAEYLFATDDSSTAAPYIISTGKAVMSIGGFNGTDKAITLKQFKKLVKEGKVKYYYSGGKTGGSNTAIVNWIKKNAKKVKLSGNNSATSSITTSTKTSSTSANEMGTPPTSGNAPSGAGGNSSTAPTSQGATPPSGSSSKKMKKPSGSSSKMKKPSKKPSNMGGAPEGMTGGMTGGMGSSGTLYDLSDIYD
ncbi:glycosyltransferase family 39 protein [Companilactobacillus allii]|uniref:ArnT family glycosyltransferase n=1 Tax=Companilactobacillus allii TaxID=1847728 RepID=UPI0009FB1360|nr:glycosyltransferase family 39 protein [Companilactobacillus allii]USQ69864.1 glycosyltransferase family 39 protein [Companilactobacillus allii]